MELCVKRTDFSEQSTIGEMSVDGKFECYTLEDKVRPVRIMGRLYSHRALRSNYRLLPAVSAPATASSECAEL